MKIRALIIVLLAMFVVSCTEELTFENPFDPATDMSYWTPKNLIITPQSPTSIKLSWEKVNGNYQGFKISRKVGSGAWQNDIATVGANTNQWTDSNANIGNTYTYRVKAYAGANNSNYVEKTQAFTLSTPTNLSITPQSATSLKLTWTDTNQFEQGYKISRKVGSGAWQDDIATVGVNVTEWIDNNANNGNTYTYRVKAYAGANNSNYVEKTQAFTLSTPTNLSITPQSATSLKLTWTDTNQFEQGYKISRKVGSGAWQNDIATVGANTNQWTDSNANIGNTYTYRVKAYAGANNSNYVEKTQAFTLSTPTNLSITPQSATSLKLTWTDTNQFEQGYKISRKVGSGAWQEDIATVGVNVTEWIDNNAPYGTNYSYRVKAYAGANNSNYVEKTQAFTLSTPTNLSITPQSATSLKLTWTDTNQFEQGYKISRKVGSGAWQEDIATVGVNVTEWIDNNAPYGTNYSYRVKAYAGANNSNYVEKTQAFTLSTPTNLSITPQSATSLKLTWTDTNQFEQGYKISRRVADGDWEDNIATVGANTNQWTDNTINAIQVFQYKVRAYYQNYYSDYSNSASAVSPFAFVQGGTFQMGSNSGDSNEKPVHSVTLSSFYISKYETNQAEWQTVMAENTNGISPTPSYFSNNPNRPVEGVSWYAALVYCNRKSIQEGLTPCYAKSGDTNPNNWGIAPTDNNTAWNAITCNWSANGYRLPTEAEWEYAARGGSQSNNYTYSGSNTVGNVAWYNGNSGNQTHDVGTKAPNELGIYDMSGNVWEWCWDWYSSSYYSSSPANNPTGPSSGSSRVVRGGGWDGYDFDCRVALRNCNSPGNSYDLLGLRVLRTIQ